jgi:ribosomal-protein-alanine N-acetyltransferase
MEVDHLEEVLAIEETVFPSPWPRSAFIHEILYNPRATMVVAHLAEPEIYPGVVGYAGFWTVGGQVHITTLAVHPKFHRRGVGRKLLEHCLDTARHRGCYMATLEVRESNVAAQRLYADYGFVVTGRRRRYYRDGEDALIMTLENL